MKTKPKAHRRGRAQRHAAGRQELLAKYQQSGQSQAAFCRAHGLNATTFSGWLHRGQDRPPPQRFAEVAVPVRAVDPTIEMELGNGVRVRLPLGADVEQTAALVRRVAGC